MFELVSVRVAFSVFVALLLVGIFGVICVLLVQEISYSKISVAVPLDNIFPKVI